MLNNINPKEIPELLSIIGNYILEVIESDGFKKLNSGLAKGTAIYFHTLVKEGLTREEALALSISMKINLRQVLEKATPKKSN